MYVHLVCDKYIIRGCRGKRTTWGSRRYNFSYMFIGLMETVSFNDSLRFDIWFEIQGHGGVGMMLLKVAGENLENKVNCNQNVLFWMRHVYFVVSGSNY